MLVNRADPQNSSQESEKEIPGSQTSQEAFLHSVEEDARARGVRRREREARGKEAKRNGVGAFKRMDYEGAAAFFTDAISEMPWDISLYTNRASVSSLMYSEPPVNAHPRIVSRVPDPYKGLVKLP